MIKRIGTEARHDLERFFDTKVFLDLRVKVNPDWRNNERTLDELGVPKSKAKKRR
jgi:GTPase